MASKFPFLTLAVPVAGWQKNQIRCLKYLLLQSPCRQNHLESPWARVPMVQKMTPSPGAVPCLISTPKCTVRMGHCVARPLPFPSVQTQLSSLEWMCKVGVASKSGGIEISCWKCGTSLDTVKDQFFCDCGVVQPPKTDHNMFQIMGIEESFDVDVGKLNLHFHDLQRRLHPDKFTQKSSIERELSEQQSRHINEAYRTLLNPLSRALYILQRKGFEIHEAESQTDPGFLMSIMEINESLADTDSEEEIAKITEKNSNLMSEIISEISEHFKNCDFAAAYELVIKLKYYVNIDEKIKEIKGNYGYQ